MAKEYLQSNGKLLMTANGELVQVPDSENLNDLADTNGVMVTQSEEVAKEIEDLIVKNGVIDGSPRGVYASLSALRTAYPSGASGVYLTTDNGHWYYWNGSAWTDGGVYQAIEVPTEVTEAVNNINGLLYGEIILDRVEYANNAYCDSENNLITTYYASKSALSQANKEIANLKEALYGYVLDTTDVEIEKDIPYTTTIGSNTYNLVDNVYGLIKEIKGKTIINDYGYLENVEYSSLEVSGANLLNIADKEPTTISGITYSIKNGVITLNGTSTATLNFERYDITKLFKQGQTYFIKQFTDNENIKVSIGRRELSTSDEIYLQAPRTFTYNGEYSIRLFIQFTKNVTYNNTKASVSIVKGSTAPTKFKPFRETTILDNFDGIVILKGVGSAKDKIVITKNTDNEFYTATKVTNIGEVDLGTLTWDYDTTYTQPRFVLTSLSSVIKKPSSGDSISNIMCSIYESISLTTLLTSTKDMSIALSVGGYISISNHNYTNATDFKNAMSGVMLQYELATPTTEVLSTKLTDSDVMPLLELGGSVEIYSTSYSGLKGSTVVEMVYRLSNTGV